MYCQPELFWVFLFQNFLRFTPLFLIEISFVLFPPPPFHPLILHFHIHTLLFHALDATVLHSPTRKMTKEEKAAWVIPPSISNWKNSKGYTIPLDKRMAADGRGVRVIYSYIYFEGAYSYTRGGGGEGILLAISDIVILLRGGIANTSIMRGILYFISYVLYTVTGIRLVRFATWFPKENRSSFPATVYDMICCDRSFVS